jgi:hypothetical protein
MAESFKIPWFIFSDGEPATIAAVNNALAAIAQNAIYALKSYSPIWIEIGFDTKDYRRYACDCCRDEGSRY